MTFVRRERREGKWQNLAKGKCPFCDDSSLRREGKVYVCDECEYYIPPSLVITYLTDKNGLARRHMDPGDIKKINQMLK